MERSIGLDFRFHFCFQKTFWMAQKDFTYRKLPAFSSRKYVCWSSRFGNRDRSEKERGRSASAICKCMPSQGCISSHGVENLGTATQGTTSCSSSLGQSSYLVVE